MDRLRELLVGLTNVVSGIVGALLGLRLLLRLFGANSENGFVDWVYDTSSALIAPFEGIFPTVRVEDGFVLEISTLFALLVYGILAALVYYLIAALIPTGKATKKSRK